MTAKDELAAVVSRLAASAMRAVRTIRRPKWNGQWTRIVRWSAIVLCVLAVAGVTALYFMDWNAVRGSVSHYASLRLGREVHIEGELNVHIFRWSPRIEANHVTIANPPWLDTPHAAEIGNLTFEFRLIPALFGNVILPLVSIDQPDIRVVRDETGRSNWDLGDGRADGWQLPPIQRFVLTDGKININDRTRKLTLVGTLASVENAGASGSGAFLLVGKGQLNQNRFVAEFHGGPLINVDPGKPYAFTADIRSGGSHVAAEGAIVRPFDFGRFHMVATFSGSNLAELYDLTGLTLPGTPPYRISGTLSRNGAQYRLAELDGTVGDSDLHGELSVDVSGDRPLLRANLRSRLLDFKDLGPVIGQRPVLSAKAASNLPPPEAPEANASTSVFPDVPLQVGKIRQMDAEVDYRADTVRSRDFPLREVATHVSLDNGVLSMNPLTFTFSRGKLTGNIQIDARRQMPVTDLDARITAVHLEQFVNPQNPPFAGQLEAHVKLHGAGNSVHKAAANASGAATIVLPRGKIRAVLAELTGVNLMNALGLILSNDRSDTDIRCAVAHFSANQGALTAQQLLIDTGPVLIVGGGTINFASERMDMSLSGKPKEPVIGRLRAPIKISGLLSNPDIGVGAGQAAAQGGIAAALGFLTPLAAVLPFVDPGLENDANCSALMVEARAARAPVATKAPTTPKHQ